MEKKSKVFISYSHKDEELRKYVEEHLAVLTKQGKLSFWSDRQIELGKEWYPTISKELNECKVAVLLISRHFLSSDFIMDKEVPLFLERQAKGELEIFMLMLSPCSWTEVECIAKLQGFPKDNKPLSSMSVNQKDEVMVEFVSKINQKCKTQSNTSQKNNLRKKPFSIPFESKNDGAIGISDKLLEVHTALQDKSSHRANIGQVTTFQGMGGLGKTQLAVEYAHRYRDEYDGVVWLTVDQDIDRQLIELAENVGWVVKEADAKDKLDSAKTKYENLENMLLIYDNVENYIETVEPLIPKANNNKILITSRTIIDGFTSIELATLNEDNSLALLEYESKRFIRDDEKDSVNKLIKELDGLPLALEMAGAYMLNAEITWSDYWQLFKRQKVSFLEKSYIYGSGTNHENNIGKTLAIGEVIFNRIPLLKEIIDLLAFSASEPMSKELLSKMLGVEEFEIAEAIQEGTRLKYIKKEDEDEIVLYALHRLVREVWKSQRELDEEFTIRVSKNLATYLKKLKDDFLNLQKLEMASFHAKAWATRSKDTSTKALLLSYAAYPYHYIGKYKDAMTLVDEAYSIVDKENDSEIYAEVLTYKASLSDSLGELKKALPYYEEALEMRKQIHGDKNHPDIANSLNNIGYVLNSLGDSKKALLYYEKAFEMRKQIHGDKNHPEIASSLNNMGSILNSLGDSKKALPYYEKALEMNKQIHEDINHPNLANSLNNMGFILDYLGDAKKALLYYEKALEMKKQIHGDKNHPDMVSSLNNVGSSLIEFKKCHQAKRYLEEAKTMMERLGYDSNKLRIIGEHLEKVDMAIKKEEKLPFNKRGRNCIDSQ
jgi:tetratricopeptide (TPR) repeat protein